MSDAADRRFRPSGEVLQQPWDRLAEWLQARGHDAGDLSPRQFSAGLANLNYLVQVDGRGVVLRRPPSGALAEGASDMAREARVLERLSESYPLAPRQLEFCEDVSVLGAPFQIIEYRPGTAVGADLPPEWAGDPLVPEVLVNALVDAMVRLHRLEPEEVGLGGLGRRGFLGRQVEGWARRASTAYDGHPPAEVATVLDWLRRRLPAEPERVSLLHCDFKLDNMLFDPVTQAPLAVVDWDMTTTGDPLFDLGVLLAYWVEPTDPVAVHAVRQVPSLSPGFPGRAEVAARYLALAGRQHTDLSFYLTLGRLRLALAWRQLFVLRGAGPAADPQYSGLDDVATAVLAWTAQTLDDPTREQEREP